MATSEICAFEHSYHNFGRATIFCFICFRNFLTDVHSCITGQGTETLDKCVSRYSADDLPSSMEVWTVPEPILPEPELEPGE